MSFCYVNTAVRPTQVSLELSHVSQLLHELQLLPQLLHLPPHGELGVHGLHALVAPQEHCSNNSGTADTESKQAAHTVPG